MSLATITAPASTSRVYIGPAGPSPGSLVVDEDPDLDALGQLLVSRSVSSLPISPSRQPNMMMWTDDRAFRMSSKILG